MKKAPLNPNLHGILDYAISGVMIAAPTLLKLKGGAKTISQIAGVTDSIINLFSDHSASATRKIDLKTHRKTDILSLVSIGAFSLLSGALKNKKARVYYLSILAVGVATVLLTDWKANNKNS